MATEEPDFDTKWVTKRRDGRALGGWLLDGALEKRMGSRIVWETR
jgi:hypothetical protein